MKPVPEKIIASGPPGTVWFGGPVDSTTVTLRVMPQARTAGNPADVAAISRLLACESDAKNPRHWRLHAPDREESGLDEQIAWIFARTTSDLSRWQQLTATYRVDIFCGLFLERPNRGASLSPATLMLLGSRGVEIGFDIYGPDR